MTIPFTTAPADTARAMHAAEMRGQDMQDAPERIWATEDKANFGEDRFHSTTPMRGLTEYTRSDLCITEAECQRLVDAAVAAEREAAKSLVWTLGHEVKAAMLVDEDNERTVLDMVKATAAAIRARGQK